MRGLELAEYRKAKRVKQADKGLLEALGLRTVPELIALERERIPLPEGFEDRYITAVDRLAPENEPAAA